MKNRLISATAFFTGTRLWSKRNGIWIELSSVASVTLSRAIFPRFQLYLSKHREGLGIEEFAGTSDRGKRKWQRYMINVLFIRKDIHFRNYWDLANRVHGQYLIHFLNDECKYRTDPFAQFYNQELDLTSIQFWLSYLKYCSSSHQQSDM